MKKEKLMGRAEGTAGTKRSGGERSEPQRSAVPAVSARPPETLTEVRERTVRRRFSAAYKLRILAEADRLEGTGEIGALLRREGLYSSHLTNWRKEREAGALAALEPKKRGPRKDEPNPLAPEVDRLAQENARLAKKLKKAEAIIEFQKKVAALLEMDEAPPSNGSAS